MGIEDPLEQARKENEQYKRDLSFYKEVVQNQKMEYEERLRSQREASKFYNQDGFWLAFWIIVPLILVLLGVSI
ncbi:MAG: hypothetical protein EBU66_16455 [Bacteroidetes bacterium]|nr:hypothetical protein [Bacteroidota bacterium]